MPRHGENIYKRRDGRYEGGYVVGRTATGKTRFGYIYGYQYTEVRNELLQKKAEQLKRENCSVRRCGTLLSDWLRRWMENEILGSVKESSYQTYLRQIKVHLLPGLGHRQMQSSARSFPDKLEIRGRSDAGQPAQHYIH